MAWGRGAALGELCAGTEAHGIVGHLRCQPLLDRAAH
jgi:hypothetical protein